MPKRLFTHAYATAIYVMALEGLGWLARQGGGGAHAVLPITDDGRTVWTDGMERYLREA